MEKGDRESVKRGATPLYFLTLVLLPQGPILVAGKKPQTTVRRKITNSKIFTNLNPDTNNISWVIFYQSESLSKEVKKITNL